MRCQQGGGTQGPPRDTQVPLTCASRAWVKGSAAARSERRSGRGSTAATSRGLMMSQSSSRGPAAPRGLGPSTEHPGTQVLLLTPTPDACVSS